jgi:hypothetical protein
MLIVLQNNKLLDLRIQNPDMGSESWAQFRFRIA